ncbi:hypothetical protein ACTWJ9_33645 (plasmid) [Streptomyces sp. GDS52]|uniref:hypothetical protein n=1 Tax=Streptomyces sp. GDS52 TaxID=3406419 RepID=UPI003FD30AAA
MFATYKESRRHNKLMKVAHNLLYSAYISAARSPADVTAQDVAADAFGRHQIELDLDEAQKFLDAARVARGESTTNNA